MPKLPILLLLISTLLFCASKEEALLASLDPHSISQHLAFYELYAETAQGRTALEHAWKLLRGEAGKELIAFPQLSNQALISLVTRQPFEPPVTLSQEHLHIVTTLSAFLSNRSLKGFRVCSKEELLSLHSEEIDLGRALLLNQFETLEEIYQYEASLDLMALQILAHLSKTPSDEEKIKEINRFIFQEMQFRFPPHSLYAKDIDLYTFLPSVLDNRQGVCLGVSILYLCLAQRLNLPLEIITPPGHIYVRYRKGEEVINIETTARGINLPSEVYLGINTRTLQQRSLKEVVGMAFFNQASVFWGKEEYTKTVELYEKALCYLPDDPLLNLFLGLNYLFVGKKTEGKKVLNTLKNITFDYAVSPETMPSDYLNGKVDIEGLKIIFLPVDETRSSILDKQRKLKKVLTKYPHFRAGLMQLATTYMQLGRSQEALDTLETYHLIDPNDASVEYYLAMLCLTRLDYRKAWSHLKQAEKLTSQREHHPKALTALRHELRSVCPN